MSQIKDKIPERLAAFIWYFLRNHPISIAGFLLIIMIASLEISLGPYVLKIIIDAATINADKPTLFLQAVIYPAVFYILLTLIHNAAMRIYFYICLKLFPKLRTEISVAMFEHLTKHSLSFFQRNFSGDLANKTQCVAEGVESIIQSFNRNILGNSFTLIIALVLLTTVHIYFAAVLLIGVIIYVMNGYKLAKKTSVAAHDFSEANSRLSGQLVDSIANIINAKIFSNIFFETTRIEDAVNRVGSEDKLLQRRIIYTDFCLNMIFTLLITLLMGGLIYFRVYGAITVGDFTFILGLSITIVNMVNGLTQAMPNLSKDIGKCQQALNVIIVPHDIEDCETANSLHVSHGEICFSDVCFNYDNNKLLFKHLNLTIQPKQKVGLVGYSGAGKTSFINLLLRLYEIQNGEIRIDEHNICSVTRDSLMKNIALIPQQTEMFHRSLMDNIRYGDTKASDDAVFRAAELAKCHEFIMQLPEGYQSLVGERGIRLSGGQRQRIAIARAILKNAPILILDEATSSLDSVTEKEIQDALRSVMIDKTVIVIAHRLSTIMSMDRILFFEGGKIIEDGPVAELEAKNGYFAKLLAMQRDEH